VGTVFVPGWGSLEDGRLLLVGEAPGREEERLQQPFVGAAGKNLTRLLEKIGLARQDVYITNLMKFRPLTPKGGNRSPTAREQRHALPHLLEELRILSPSLVVCLGLSAARALLEDPGLKMSASNGALFHAHSFRVFVTYHPSPLNYLTLAKRQALQAAFSRIESLLAVV
jgi:DNA polymerase